MDEAVTDGTGRAVWSDGWLNVFSKGGDCAQFWISFAEVADFLIDFAKKEIFVREVHSHSPEGIRHLLDDQIVPRILAHEGELVLHAAAVASAEGAVLLAGPSGAGKSSLAASLHNSGYRLLGDDAIVVSTSSGSMIARAIYRSLRLFPDSVAALIDSAAELTPVAGYTTKRNIAYLDDCQADEQLPIRAAFLLDAASHPTVRVEPVAASEACMAFVEHSFWMDPTDLSRAKGRMVQACALAASVPTFRLTYPREYFSLPTVRDAIAGVLA